MFELSSEKLTDLGAEITTREIKQQPELWQEAFEYYKEEENRIKDFLDQIKAKHPHTRVIFTGAGSSAYVGDTVVPYLKEVGDEKSFEFQAVPTTSIVSNPKSYFKKDFPTILVSFARSGNSPESVASVQHGQNLVDDFYQITITCAPEGKLAEKAQGDEKNLLLLMPARSNDQGFAMTGSFTCMTLSAILVFDPKTVDEKAGYVSQMRAMAEDLMKREQELQDLIDQDFNRVIYLGSGPQAGISREVQLKILELTAGKVATAFDSSLGFRHGPKSFIDDKSIAFLYVSNDPYTRQYDVDMLKELNADKIAKIVYGISVEQDNNFDGSNFTFDKSYADLPDAYLALPYTMFGQIISLMTAIKVGNKPDTPSPTGTVNRVVKGVTIHENL
ncbi:SIS domain-containing protein [Jeotgalibaca sp. MA1X17-3]|uniref:SIS domain-containing protein n=1 Tax=Jeotgalibaca sp. MA1X17-3 TaxID=2908211 RepID=UPI001F26B859|nr:SIS domain-containing protein [Jeotgalibaca sp. MA1X17-3]UJF15345.1 SIS domain-containing protein [Jeotgalibaca sp. MA1X17-3]